MSDDEFADFELRVAFDGTRVRVAVRGDVDRLSAPALAGVLNSSVDAGCRHLVVDLAECRFMDASGLGVLVGVAMRMSGLHGTVTVGSASTMVGRLLELTGVSEVIPYAASDSTGASLAPEVDSDLDDGDDASSVVPAPTSTALVRSSSDVIDAALRLVTELADATIDHADGVSVTLERYGRLMTVAASNDKVFTMDRHQYETGEGPCLAAKADGRSYYIESLDDETRWPTFVPLALEQGIHSILSSPLMTDKRPQGALNIYSSREQAFGTHEQELAGLFANQASEILTSAGSDLTDEEANQRFVTALTARRTIHQAQGVVMARDGLTADDAMGSLLRAARAAGVTVLIHATDLVASLPDERLRE